MYGYRRINQPRSIALFGLCAALLSVPALSNEVRVGVNPTTSYTHVTTQTVRLPPNATVTASSAPVVVNPVPGGGLQQTMPAGIEINAIKSGSNVTKPVQGNMNTALNIGNAALKGGLTACLVRRLCHPGAIAGAAGISALMEHQNWNPQPDGSLTRPLDPSETGDWLMPPPPDPSAVVDTRLRSGSGTSTDPCSPRPDRINVYCQALPNDRYSFAYCMAQSDAGGPLIGYVPADSRPCKYGAPGDPPNYPTPGDKPVTDEEIEQGVNDNYAPQPTDWPLLSRLIDKSANDVNVEVISAPPISDADNPQITQNPDGTTTSVVDSYTFNPVNNPSKQPAIEVVHQQTTTVYDQNANPISTTTTSNTLKPSNPPASSPMGPPVNVNVPTDCDFMPTVCRFLDWFQADEPVDDPYEELSGLTMDLEIDTDDVHIGDSNASCPQPYEIALTWVPAVSVSYQPFCDLASAVRYWLIAIAYFSSAYLAVRSL